MNPNSSATIVATAIGSIAGLWSYFYGQGKKNQTKRRGVRIMNGFFTGLLVTFSSKSALDFSRNPDKNALDLPFAITFGACAISHELQETDN